jgi:PTS system ascorbate-specific IIA component
VADRPQRRKPDNLPQLFRFKMTGLLVIAHAPLASALRAVAVHVYPECANSLAVLDVAADVPIEQVESQAAALLARLGTRDALILTDVFGATPCNVAQRLADGVHVKVVTGVSVPMLWRSLCYAGESLDSLVGRALAGATQGAMQVSPQRPQEQVRNSLESNAANDGHDHQ